MNQGRRHKGEIRYQEVQGTRSYNKKPLFHGTREPNVLFWEKRFCYCIGSVPWCKLVETKKTMYLYKNIIQWDDSACEEAFHNAKGRFWAKTKGLPCDLPQPDPNMYIDEIDWNSEIDPELYLDLEREPPRCDENDNREEVVILNNLPTNQSYSSYGWGDFKDEDIQKPETTDLDAKDQFWDRNACRQSGNSWKAASNGGKNNYNGNEWRRVSERGSGGGEWDMSRYKTSRFNGGNYQMDRGWWRSGRGRKRVNFVC